MAAFFKQVFMLLQVATGALDNIIQTGGTLAVLAFFLIYFMKEQKEVRAKMDALTVKYEADIKDLRNQYDTKVESMVRRMDEISQKSITALGDVKNSNDRLSDAVNHLTEKLN
jgi:hypothetical protein